VDKKLLTVRDVAERFSVKEVTIRRWIKRGQLSGMETPAGWRFEEADIQRWMDRYRTPLNDAPAPEQRQ